jgi:hypothetical protein
VFLEWMNRLTWFIENDGEYFPKWIWLIYNLYGTSSGLALSEGLFRHPILMIGEMGIRETEKNTVFAWEIILADCFKTLIVRLRICFCLLVLLSNWNWSYWYNFRTLSFLCS